MSSASTRLAICAVAAAAITALAALGALFRLDSMLSDRLYQKPRPLSGEVLVIGIDARSLEDIGPINMWGRDIYAMAIEALNSGEDSRPCVIGIDVIFAGSTNPGADEYLSQAAAAHGNVVVAASAEIGSALAVGDGGRMYMDNSAVLSYDEPYPALSSVAGVGHINAMNDTDGVLRHVMLGLDLPDGRHVPSFSRLIYQKYAAQNGLDPAASPPAVQGQWWYLPFSALPGGFYDGVSLSQLIAGEVPSDYFAGKVVLIGPYALGLQDRFFTAIDIAEPMYGVEYQANAIEAMITGNFKRKVSESPQLLLLFLVSLCCLYWFWERNVAYATAALVALCGGWILLCVNLYERGYMLHPLWVPLSVTISYIACMAANYMRASADRRRITDTFKRYVAPEIVGELLKEGSDALQLGGKTADIAVLFVDIRGFTPMSEILAPERVVEILNHYLTLTSSCIINNGGTLDKFVGDATMAFWGAPLPQEDYIYKAAKAAVEMVEGSHKLGAELLERYGRTVSFGVGIHCGRAVVGNIGAPMRMDYTVIGDTVNTAARLESNAGGGKIFISRAVADALGERALTTSLGGSIKLKGKSEGFEILTLDSLKDSG